MLASQERMTSDEFRAELDRLRFTQVEAAIALGVNDRTIRRWILGERPIPPVVTKLLATLEPKEETPMVRKGEPINEFAARRLDIAKAAAAEAHEAAKADRRAAKAAERAARKAAEPPSGRGVAPAPSKAATRPRKAIASAARGGGKATLPRRGGTRHA